MLLIRLFSRTFVTIKTNESKYKTIVIKEIPKHLKENDIIELDSSKYLDINNSINSDIKNIKIKLVKLIKKKIDIIRFKRRKRLTRRVGYNQHIGYFHIIN
ncbi:hypothetical protein IOLA_027 [uncultured bacterium]|uniref:50S ribosomal protein L21 n=1 Tax=uncultured microorganism TaxID=358574 RepID=A0A077JJH1_9ZZZZ|nr:hypothetical protein [uncultured microorganism]BCL65659.1 hypothetical protein IOLA_027 [uncultured bacterium]